MKYDFHQIEKKWQQNWQQSGVFHAQNNSDKPKFFALVEFPYPSGAGLHVGHPRSYTALDIVSRKRRMEGYNVLYPMGWDAFGLPTENFAIKNHVSPAEVTKKNIARFKSQLQAIGLSFDWEREINTTDPDYYKWTQWIFLKFFEKGLAYKATMPVNWCTSCKCVLANEEVVGGVCERCGSQVLHMEKSQWMLKITEYADRLIDDLALVDYPDRVKAQQINWIGRSHGAEIKFPAADSELVVYTTRPDTIFGATYMVISPEHPFIDKHKDLIENYEQLCEYREQAKKKSDLERTELSKEKTGVKICGTDAVNPATGKHIPIFVSDYVLMSYGTGAIMAVPAHDTRDHEFAEKFNLPIIEVVSGGADVNEQAFTDTESGIMVNSGFLDGLTVEQAKKEIIARLEADGKAKAKTNYKLRDWIFSRQRYWGEPIPLVRCEHCGWVPVPESELPLRLPEVTNYEPTETGESPLAKMTDWVNTVCPKCGAPARRETDTMPNWAGSSWYFMRYTDPKCTTLPASREALDYWMPVDWYNGGMEHTTLHLLYSRFWHKFLYDIGLVSTPEPYNKRTSHGMILAENGEKMSKSRGNVVNPDDIIEQYGADTLRLYIMFIGDFEKAAPWSQSSIRGCRRFVERVISLSENVKDGEQYSEKNIIAVNKTIKKVGEDIESLKFNTAIASMMSLVNVFYENGVNRAEFGTLLALLNPFAPHFTEELWQSMKLGDRMLAVSEWPKFDPSKVTEDSVEVGVQINGKFKTTVTIPLDCEDKAAQDAALADGTVAAAVSGKNIVKVIVVKNRIINIIAK